MESNSNNILNNKVLNYVPIERLYEIARQLADYELNSCNYSKNKETVSLLETNCGHYQKIFETNNNNNNNYCEVVSVPTSAHVAQIVGKQGINTYIHIFVLI